MRRRSLPQILEGENLGPKEIDQHRVGGQPLADFRQVDPGFGPQFPATRAGNLFRQLPFSGDKGLDLCQIIRFLAGRRTCRRDGGQLAAHPQQLLEDLLQGRVFAVATQKNTLCQCLLDQALPVEDPLSGEFGHLRILAPRHG